MYEEGTGLSDLGAGARGGGSGVKTELYYYKQENQDGLKRLVAQFVAENPDIIKGIAAGEVKG